MNNQATSQDNFKGLLLAVADVLNEQRAKLPTGCVSESTDGAYNAHSISNVMNLANNVNAPDGFIKDGLLVRFAGQRKAGKDDKFHGYRVIFELNGIHNGVYTVFTRTEFEYKIYLDRSMWKVEVHKILYKAINKDGQDMDRNYKIPMVMDLNSGEFRCTDNRNTLENKVGLAMKSKLSADYDAYYGDLKYDEAEHKFIEVDTLEVVVE